MRSAAVGLTVGTHMAYLAYLPSGGFLALRWPRNIAIHIPVVIWGIGVVVFELPCPLTELEQRARSRAGMEQLPASAFHRPLCRRDVLPVQPDRGSAGVGICRGSRLLGHARVAASAPCAFAMMSRAMPPNTALRKGMDAAQYASPARPYG